MDLLKKEYKSIIDGLKDSLAKFKGSSLKEQESHIDEIQQLRTKIREFEAEVNALKLQFNQKELLLKAEISKNDEITQQLNSIKDTLKSERNEFASEKEELLHRISDLTHAKDVLKAQYSELSSRLKQMADEGMDKDSAISKNNESYEKNIKILNAKIELLTKDIDKYKDSIEGLKQELNNQEIEFDQKIKNKEAEFLSKLSDKDIIIKEKDTNIEDLKMELRVMGQKLSSSSKDSVSYEREIQLKESEIQQLK